MALNNKDAGIVLGMIARGDSEHHIAAWFGENQGRVAEIKGGSQGNVPLAKSNELPPKGPPGPKGRKLRAFVQKAIASLEAGDSFSALETLKAGLSKYNSNEA